MLHIKKGLYIKLRVHIHNSESSVLTRFSIRWNFIHSLVNYFRMERMVGKGRDGEGIGQIGATLLQDSIPADIWGT